LFHDPAKDLENIKSGNQFLGKAFSEEKAQNLADEEEGRMERRLICSTGETEDITQVSALCPVERNGAAESGKTL